MTLNSRLTRLNRAMIAMALLSVLVLGQLFGQATVYASGETESPARPGERTGAPVTRDLPPEAVSDTALTSSDDSGTVSDANQAQNELGLDSTSRFGVATNSSPLDYDYGDLGMGWYHNWTPHTWDNTHLPGVEFVATVGAWGDLMGSETADYLAACVNQCPESFPEGTIWIVGNELDLETYSTKNGEPISTRRITGEEYAQKYKKYHDMIKAIDPTFKVGIGCLISSYTFLYDAQAEYQRLYGTKMPIDVYTMHGYMNTGNVDHLVQVKLHVNRLRPIMKEFGDQDKWLFVTETGALYDAGETVISDYMEEVFDYLTQERSTDYGCPSDNYLMVQRWAWFALTSRAPENDHRWEGTDLFDIDTKEITAVGETYAAYPKTPPVLPSSFWGTVTLDGQNVAEGSSVTAWIDDVQVASASAQMYEGSSVYSIDVPGDDDSTTEREGGAEGDTVRFKIGDSWAQQQATWSCGAVSNLDLTASGASENCDLDGDGMMDLVVWRESRGTWYGLESSEGYDPAQSFAKSWGSGANNDTPLSGDLDGDGKMDLIVWRPASGTWYGLLSSTDYSTSNTFVKTWGSGAAGDIPILGDLDGDGKMDLIVWRPSSGTWYGLRSTQGYSTASYFVKVWGSGARDDQPMAGDLDGDGKMDLIVYRPGNSTWYGLLSSTGYSTSSIFAKTWGSSALGDEPILGDIDGDGRSDLIVWRPTNGTWYGLQSSEDYSVTDTFAKPWGSGAHNDVPIAGDLDGDGQMDLTVWRPASGTWYGLQSSQSYSTAEMFVKRWGSQAAGDVLISGQ